MDFQILGEETLKIKGKKVGIAVDPKEKISKFDADAIISTDNSFDPSRVNDYRVIISGPGEYEVLGLKIAGIKAGDGTIYELISENTNVLVARSSDLENISSDKLDNYRIVIINVNSDLKQGIITAMEPSAVLLYGEKRQEGAKNLDGASSKSVPKISLSEDKLPEELEVTLLG